MPDPVSISNEAIGELGGVFIQAFDEGTSTARLCAQLYPGARDMTLELHPWNWATAYQTLTRSPDAPAMKWAYQYALPTQPWCIKVRGTDRGNGARFEVGTNAQGERVLYSDDASVKLPKSGLRSPDRSSTSARWFSSLTSRPLSETPITRSGWSFRRPPMMRA